MCRFHLKTVMYTQPSSLKRQKTKDVRVEENEVFAGIQKIEYRPDTNANADDFLRYRYYNPNERLQGRSMEEWLRPTLSLSRGFSQNCDSVLKPWTESSQVIDNYKRSIKAAFELCTKLGLKWWTATDKDIIPEGDSMDETQQHTDEMVEYILELQRRMTVKPLWLSTELDNKIKYWNGACTNPEVLVLNQAGFDVKRTLDMGNKLGAECFLFPGCDIHHSLNTDYQREMRHYAQFLKMIYSYKERMGHRKQLLIDCYDSKTDNKTINNNDCINMKKDPMKTLCFLKHYNLDKHYKLNISTDQDHQMLSLFGSLGSITVKNLKANMKDIVMLMRTIVLQGGISPAGFNIILPYFDGMYDEKELCESFVACIDMYAKGLKIALKLINDANLNKSTQLRYSSFSSGWGMHFENSETTLEECEEELRKNYSNLCLKQTVVTRYEHWDAILTQLAGSTLK